MQGIIDRIENSIVVVEINGKIENISKDLFEGNIAEGDVVNLTGGIWLVSQEQTRTRREKVEKLANDLWVD